MTDQPERPADDADTSSSTARRAFLRKAGIYAAVTPPAMVTMMTVMAKPALASGSGRPGGDSGGPPKDGDHPGKHYGKKRGWSKDNGRGRDKSRKGD